MVIKFGCGCCIFSNPSPFGYFPFSKGKIMFESLRKKYDIKNLQASCNYALMKKVSHFYNVPFAKGDERSGGVKKYTATLTKLHNIITKKFPLRFFLKKKQRGNDMKITNLFRSGSVRSFFSTFLLSQGIF